MEETGVKVVKTSAKGQVVIPADLREQIGLRAGAKVVVRLTGDGAVQIRPVPQDPIAAGRGMFASGVSLIEALKKERREDEAREQAKIARFLRAPGLAERGARRRSGRRASEGR